MDIDYSMVRDLVAIRDRDAHVDETDTERLIEALDACYPSEEAREN